MKKGLLPVFALALSLLGGSVSSASSPTSEVFGSWHSGGPLGGPAMAVAASPEYATDGLVLAGGGQWLSGYGDRMGKGLFRTTDGGQSWSADGNGIDSQYSSSIEDVAFSSHWSSDGTAFVGTWGGIYRTADWGVTWQRVAGDVLYNPGAVTTVAISPGFYLDGIVLAAGGFGGLFMSEDGGDNWNLTLGGVLNAADATGIGAFSGIAYSPDFIADTTAFASDWAGVWRTEDRGGQWERVLDTPTWSVRDVEVSCNFSSDGLIFAATATQTDDPPYLMRSTDRGDSWDPADTGLDRVIGVMATYCQGTTTTLYAAGDVLFRSEDDGDTWQQLANWPEGIQIKDLFVSAPAGPSAAATSGPHLFAATYQGVYRSSDGGESWQLCQGFSPLKTSVVAPSTTYSADGVLYAGTEAGVYRSGDRGLTWQPANKGLVGDFMADIGDVVLSPEYATDHTLYASSSFSGRLGGTVYRSADEGLNWEALWTTEYVDDLAISPGFSSDNTLFATATGGMVYRSTDGGASFSSVLTEAGFNAFEVAISPEFATDGTVYASGFGPLYQSTDGGDSWTGLPEGWPPHFGIAISPQFGMDDTLFLSYRELEGSGLRPESGIIRSTDGGATWDLATSGLPGTYEPWPQSIALSPGFGGNARLYTAMSGQAHLGPNQVYASANAADAWAALPPIGGEPALHALSLSTEPGGQDVLHAASSSGAWHYTSVCMDGLANGGFEFDDAWVQPDTPVPSEYSLDLAHTGNRSLKTGILGSEPNVTSWSSAYQTIMLPQDVGTATLRFWTYAVSGETQTVAQSAMTDLLASPAAVDVQYALVLDDQGELLETLLWQVSDSRTWTAHEYDLSPYRGETIRIHIGSSNDGTGGKTAMFVDDVSLELCPELPPTPTPTTTSTPTPTAVLDHHVYLPLVLKEWLEPTPTATVTPPPSCVEAVANSGFEDDGSWLMPVTPAQAGYSTAYSLNGLRSMRLGIGAGGWNVYSYSSSKQFVHLPATQGTAILSFWYYPVSGEAYSASSGTDLDGYSILAERFDKLQLPETAAIESSSAVHGNDRQYALMQDAYGNWYLLLWTLSNSRSWQRVDLDLTAFLGQTVLIHFETYNDGWWGTTAMYVDDVSIQVCGPDVPQLPTPTPASTSALPSILTTIPLGLDSHPHGVAVDTAADRVFVGLHGTNHDGHEIAVIDSSNFTVLETIDLGAGAAGPNGVAYHEATDRVYVANRNSHNVSVVDPTAGLVMKLVPVGNMPNGVGIVGDWVYVANFGVGTVSAIDATTATVQHAIAGVGAYPAHFAVNSADELAYVTANGDNRVTMLDNGLPIGNVGDISKAYGIAYDPNSGLLFVGNRSFHHTISVIEAHTLSVIDVVDIGCEPFMMVVNPNTNHLFVAATDELLIYRASDLSMIVALPLPAGSEEGIALDPLRDLVYVSSRDSDSLTVIQDVP